MVILLIRNDLFSKWQSQQMAISANGNLAHEQQLAQQMAILLIRNDLFSKWQSQQLATLLIRNDLFSKWQSQQMTISATGNLAYEQQLAQ